MPQELTFSTGENLDGIVSPVSLHCSQLPTHRVLQDRHNIESIVAKLYGTSEQPSILRLPGISDLHRPRIFPVLLPTLPEAAIHAAFRDTPPSPPPAVCGAGTGSPGQSWRTADDDSSESRGIAPSRNRRCASESGTDVPPSLALWPSPGSCPFVTCPQSSCTSLSGWSYLALAEPPAGWFLPVPDIHRRPTPCAPRRAAGPAACACPPPKPPTCTPNAHGLAWSPLRCVPSARSTTAFPCASDASPGRALHSGSWSTRAHE